MRLNGEFCSIFKPTTGIKSNNFQNIEVPCQIELIERFSVLDYVSSKLHRKY